MGVKKTNFFNFNWQASTPVPFVPNTALSGVLTGAMASTNSIYSNIQDLTNTDNQGLEITYTGTPTGTITIYGSVSGATFYSITFTPVLTQPSGGAGGYLVNLFNWPWRYIYVGYVNSSGSGNLTVWLASKDVN